MENSNRSLAASGEANGFVNRRSTVQSCPPAQETQKTSDCAAEEWRPVAGHPAYEVSDLGRVRRAAGGHGCRAGRLLKPKVGTRGYLQHCLSGGKRGAQQWIETHVLVARAFLGEPPEGQEVDHEDRDRSNARLSNLRYLTHAENLARVVCIACGDVGHGRCGPQLARRERNAAARHAQPAVRR